MNALLKAQLINVFTAQVEGSITHTFNSLVSKFGVTMKGIANSRDYRVWSETVRPCCDSNRHSPISTSANYSLNTDKLAKFAALMADSMADEVLAKVNAKVSELQDSNVLLVSGADFVITGTKNRQPVRIEQNQIINVSVKGKLFNQYPSRIYVNNKFTSAANFANI